MSGRAYLLVGVSAAILLGAFVGGRALMRADRGSGGVISRAPSFQAITLDAPPQVRTLDDYEGDVVLLNIWATWCAPCRFEMPSMQKLHESFADRGLKVVAVSIDDPAAGEAIRQFVREYGLTFEVLHDTTGAIRRSYGTSGIPETAVIGRDGVVRRRVAGAEDWNSAANRALIERLVSESPRSRSKFGSS
jgi:cytochrome c biogenesis protein CcmG, thiol:disulfide interchange protein DsbE